MYCFVVRCVISVRCVRFFDFIGICEGIGYGNVKRFIMVLIIVVGIGLGFDIEMIIEMFIDVECILMEMCLVNCEVEI